MLKHWKLAWIAIESSDVVEAKTRLVKTECLCSLHYCSVAVYWCVLLMYICSQ